MALRLKYLLPAGLGLLFLALTATGGPPPGGKAPPAGEEKESPETDPLGANAACYVCHLTFVKEELSKVHLAKKVGCVQCHGLSEKHANDEDIGASKPDITYKREQVDESCLKCHETHKAPASKVVGRFLERKLPGERAAVCTECHGTHKIAKSAP